MSSVFYPGQTDYIDKLNILGDSISDTSITGTAGGTTTLNFQLGSNFLLTMPAGNTTIAFSNIPSGSIAYRAIIIIRQDGVGSRTITAWPASVKWPTGGVQQPSTAANSYSVYELITFDSGTIWFAAKRSDGYV